MIKEFLEKYDWMRLYIQHLGINGGGFKVSLYNTTYSFAEPVFEHFINDEDLSNLRVDFETAIMTPVVNWMLAQEEKRKEILL